jgi:hypothetical protein
VPLRVPQITALQIAALKKIGRGSKILLLDRFGNSSKAVAKELSRRGFGRVFVVAGGCSWFGDLVCFVSNGRRSNSSQLHAGLGCMARVEQFGELCTAAGVASGDLLS